MVTEEEAGMRPPVAGVGGGGWREARPIGLV